MLQLIHKKGDPKRLDGRVTVYAMLEIDAAELLSMKHPIAAAVHNGMLVAQGNFKDQNSLRDFLKSELGPAMNDLGEGLSDLVDRMSGIESALDPQKLKDRLENMGDFEEFIPTPAKVVPFHSEQEILLQDGDVYFAGSFKNIGNAVLCVNAVPIVYQARYREQEMQSVRNEIESLITQIEQSGMHEIPAAAIGSGMSVEERILKEYIPEMLYRKKEKEAFAQSQDHFRIFLKGYQFPADIQAVIDLIASDTVIHERESQLLELYAKKIGALCREDFSAAENYAFLIQKINNASGDTH